MNPTDNTENEIEIENEAETYESAEVNTSEAHDDAEINIEDIHEDEHLNAAEPKRYKNRTLIVAAGIFAVTALSFGAWYAFFNNDISDVWETEAEIQDNSGNTHKEVMKISFEDAERMSFFTNEKSYFSDKEATTLKVKNINGGRSWSGIYNIDSTESGNIVQMYFPASQGVFSYNYELFGNIFTGRTLKLTNGDDVMEFTQSEETYALDPDEDFKPNTGVVGSWDASGVSYVFTEDGRFSEDTGDKRIDGVYNFGESDDGYDAIIVKYKYNGTVASASIPYLLKGDTMTLTFNGYDVDLTKNENQ